jgi:phospholipase C
MGEETKVRIHPGIALAVILASAAVAGGAQARARAADAGKVQHVVVIFQENVSFDHYFGTYPLAANPPGQPAFHAAPGTPRPVDLLDSALLTHNPNRFDPQRLSRSDWPLCDLSHDYDPELREWNGGRMNRFVPESVDYERSDRPGPTYGSLPKGVTGGVTTANCTTPLPAHTADQARNKEVMDYYDGNTVTALWNYAQHGVLFDQSFDPTFGPSTPGALNLISGQTGDAIVPAGSDDQHPCTDLNWSIDKGLDCFAPSGTPTLFVGDTDLRNNVVIGDPEPAFDDCAGTNTAYMRGRNIGDLLNMRNVTWGFFEGGFRPQVPATPTSKAQCTIKHRAENPFNGFVGSRKTDYSAHHEPFQYYRSTANPAHLPPSSTRMIGRTDQANHQYDMTDFRAALDDGVLPAVSFLKAPRYQDGHAGYSDPIDEQHFVVDTVNRIERSRFWGSTAIFIAYDDSDGFYDQVSPPIINLDGVSVPGPVVNGRQWPGNMCGPGIGDPSGFSTTMDRCGYGPRLPMLVLSPWVKPNTLDSTVISTDAILRFLEDRFAGGQRIGNGSLDNVAGNLGGVFDAPRANLTPVVLNPSSGQPTG